MAGNENGLDPAAGQQEEMPRRGSASDVRPNQDDPDPRTRGGQPREKAEDRPMVGKVTPKDYPAADRERAKPD